MLCIWLNIRPILNVVLLQFPILECFLISLVDLEVYGRYGLLQGPCQMKIHGIALWCFRACEYLSKEPSCWCSPAKFSVHLGWQNCSSSSKWLSTIGTFYFVRHKCNFQLNFKQNKLTCQRTVVFFTQRPQHLLFVVCRLVNTEARQLG